MNRAIQIHAHDQTRPEAIVLALDLVSKVILSED